MIKDTLPFGIQKNGYYYDRQIRRMILICMTAFSGLQVKIGQRKAGTTEINDCSGIATEDIIREDTLIPVPIIYGHMDRVVAAIIANNTQNTPIRLPLMSLFVRNLDFKRDQFSGMLVEQRQTYVPRGGTIPEDIQVAHSLKAIPYTMEFEVNLVASNSDQHWQMLEQIMMIFNPSLQIQMSDGALDRNKITSIELKSINLDLNYPVGQDRRMAQSTLVFEAVLYLATPVDIRRDFVSQILLRVGAVDAATTDEEVVEVLNQMGIEYEIIQDLQDLSIK